MKCHKQIEKSEKTKLYETGDHIEILSGCVHVWNFEEFSCQFQKKSLHKNELNEKNNDDSVMTEQQK